MTFPATRNDHEIALTAVVDSVQSSVLLRSYSVQDNSWPTRAPGPARHPAGCPGAERSLSNHSGRYMSNTMAMTQARCHPPAQTLTA
jgi:hypothetical protein